MLLPGARIGYWRGTAAVRVSRIGATGTWAVSNEIAFQLLTWKGAT